jgi:hypothetical protein
MLSLGIFSIYPKPYLMAHSISIMLARSAFFRAFLGS